MNERFEKYEKELKQAFVDGDDELICELLEKIYPDMKFRFEDGCIVTDVV